ncbi:YhbD family protein [Geobacillus proteiniphilus]|uniref:YhbD family protein n=1 Tax=Geobacillus proteiniphilus TaxID=860353 RepID=A0ABY9MIU6_9BACL|nr:YhbD family protein [Geobacillus proteiniphilus]WMJ17513.1 YhbD family protein [Geobacillus proteiniphilus]
MEQELISKKELLELTGISYGQLYRWKRKKLIPEEWFIRKSTFTGQETFFPKEKILARIEKIKELKDELSLDELAGMFSPNPAAVMLTKEEVLERHIVSEMVVQRYSEWKENKQVFSFTDLLPLYVLDQLLRSGDLSWEEGKSVLNVFETHYPKLQGKSCELAIIRKMGVTVCLLVAGGGDMYVEPEAKLVARLHVPVCIEELKLKISEG